MLRFLSHGIGIRSMVRRAFARRSAPRTANMFETLIVNRKPKSFVLVLEPWVDEVTVRPGTTAKIRSENARHGELIEVVVEADRIVVWGVGVSCIEYDGEIL